MDALWKDVRFAVRMLRRTPGVAAAAVVALALGIGANSAIFSVVDGVLLRPLPYHDSRALVVVRGEFPTMERSDVPISYPEFKDIVEQSRTLAAAGVFADGDSNLSGAGGPPERIETALASASFFPTLGVEPFIGRSFTHEEEFKGADQVAILDFAFWQARFGSDGDVVGKSLSLDGTPYRIIGVLPRGFHFQDKHDVWIPLSTSLEMVTHRGSHWLKLVARKKPGVSRAQLDADLATIVKRVLEANPRNYRGGSWGLREKPLIDDVVGNVRLALLVLLAAVGFVLLIACANVANLMLARAASRHREMAIRTALGAGRMRLVRQLLTESLLLSAMGAALGLLLAVWGVDALIAISPDALPRAAEVALDGRVLAFTIGIALVTGVGFGLAPALAGSRPDLNEGLKDGTRGTSSSRGRLRKTLVVAEVALSLVLLVGTGLMLRSFVKLRAVDPGIRPEHVLTLHASLPAPNGPPSDADRARWVAWFERAATRIAQLPGVEAVGSANCLPFDGNNTDFSFEIENYEPRSAADVPDNEAREVLPGYFAALGIPLVRGRLLGDADTADAPGALVINQTMARRYWPNGEDPIGKRLRLDRGKDKWSTIVGIVGDVHTFGLDEPVRAEMYFPYAQMRRSGGQALVVRTSGDPAAMANTVRVALAELDPAQPLFDVKPMSELLSASLAQRRFALMLMLVFAAVALLLAAVGIYGVMSYTVAQRTQEIGIRVALGASPQSVLSMVVKDGMKLVAIGLAVGLVAALLLTRLVSSMLYGVSATDAPTFAAIAAVLAAVALLAIVIPARRATRVDPMLALRAD